jgi:uncharacterized protein
MTKKQKSNTVKWVEFGLFLLVVLSIIAPKFQNPLYSFLTGVSLFGLTVYFLQRNFTLFGPSLFFLIVYLYGFATHPLLKIFFLAAPLVVYVGILAISTKLKSKSWFLKMGKPGSNSWILGIVTVIVSSAALYIWMQVSDTDISSLKDLMPRWSLPVLIITSFLWAALNSLCEESIYRGILYDSLKNQFDSRIIVILIQAAIYGLAHLQGFPGGITGVALYFTYGLLLGIIRHRSHGLLAPMVVHTAADFTIFMLVLGEIGKL